MLETEDVQRDRLFRLRVGIGALHQQAVSARTTDQRERGRRRRRKAVVADDPSRYQRATEGIDDLAWSGRFQRDGPDVVWPGGAPEAASGKRYRVGRRDR